MLLLKDNNYFDKTVENYINNKPYPESFKNKYVDLLDTII